MIRMSTGLKTSMLGDHGFAAMLQYGGIELYTGLQPLSADDPPTGQWIATVTNQGVAFTPGKFDTGLKIDASGFGVLRDTGDWIVRGRGTGTVGWWRWRWAGEDPRTLSPFYPRLDGAAGESLILSNYDVDATTRLPIDSFVLTFTEV
jgi:hypothetical protein